MVFLRKPEKGKEVMVKRLLRKYVKNGVTRISREAERTFFFYATIALVLVYLVHRLIGGS